MDQRERKARMERVKKIEQIENEIRELIKRYLGIEITEKNKNLLDRDIEVPIVDWLYVILEMERTYQKEISAYIAEEKFHFFTIENLAKKIASSS